MATTSLSFNEIAGAASIDFAASYATDYTNLKQVLNAANWQVLPVGTALQTRAVSATLQDGNVAEGVEITASTFTRTTSLTALTYKKYRALVGFETIQTAGLPAVAHEDAVLRAKIQGDLKGIFATALATGTGTATGTDFQKACANAWAALNTARDGYASTPVFFCSPTTAAGYLGSAAITMQTAFGLSYITNFLGMGTLIVVPGLTASKVYATAQENLVIASADVQGIGAGFVTDESGIVAVKHAPKDENAAMQIVVIGGAAVVPEFLSHIIVATISA